MIRRPFAAALVLPATLLVACAPAVTTPSPEPSPPAPTTPAAQPGPPAHGTAAIAAADVSARIGYLASDALRGRSTPSPELDQAADYVAAELARFGVQPAGEGQTYFQRYPLQSPLLQPAAALLRVDTTGFAYSTDFFLVPGPVDSIARPAIYVGTARADMSVPAEVAGNIMVAALPGSLGDQATMQAWQGGLQAALLAGLGAGAAAVVLVLDPAFTVAALPMLATMTAQQESPVPLAAVTHQAAAPAFAAAGHDLDVLRATEPAAPVALSAPFVIRSATGRTPALAPNVVGVLAGSDSVLRGEYVVFSAHIDHVGVGVPDATGDSIYNGADDDASGVTAVLEVAQAFAAQPTAPKRSLLFLFVSGEEKGLLGSQHYAAHPTVPLEQVVANVNIDMIGRNHPDSVVAIGLEYTDIGATLQRVAAERAAELKLTVAPDLWPEENLFRRSDHYSFAARGVPAIFFTTGLHDDYHKPSDEPETIDNDKLARIAQLVRHLGQALADAPARPQWTAQGREVVKLK